MAPVGDLSYFSFINCIFWLKVLINNIHSMNNIALIDLVFVLDMVIQNDHIMHKN